MTNKNSTYKRLGDYIRDVNIRNKDLSVTKLMGINIEKYFMPSVANVIGTDMTNYKVVANGQFACNLMHVGRDEKIPVALNTEDSIIVSPAYFVFEVCNEALLPEYLELSFRNPEFDRNAWFHTDADVRGGMDKDGMKDLLIPVPPIEEQRSIVNRYKAIENRIANNKQTIAKLEEAAQAVYRKMFVDDVDVENLPEGWRMGTLGEVIEIKYGKDYKQLSNGNIPLYGSGGIMGFVNKSLYNGPSILIPRKGSLNNILLVTTPFWSVDTMFYSVLKVDDALYYTYHYLRTIDFLSIDMGSAVPSMTTEHLNHMELIIPSQDRLKDFEKIIDAIYAHCNMVKKENEKLTELLSVVMAGMER